MADSDSKTNTRQQYGTESLPQLVALVTAIIVLAYGVLGPAPEGLSQDGLLSLSIFGFALFLWQSRAVPYVISSLLVVVFLFTFDIVPSFEKATVGFSSTLFFFFFVLLVLGHAIAKVNLDSYVAQHLLRASKDPHHSTRRLGEYVLAVSFLMPSGLARMVAFTPIVEKINDLYGLNNQSSFLTSSFLILGQLNPIASMSLMTGGGLPIIGSAMIRSSGRSIKWLEWAVYMAPPTILIFVLGVIAVLHLHPPDAQTAEASSVSAEVDPLTHDQFVVGVVMGATLLAWAVGSLIGIPTLLPAVGAVAILSAPYVRVFSAEDLGNVNWGILFLVGSMLSLIEALEVTGAFAWVIEGVSQIIPFEMMGAWMTIGIVLLFVVCLRVLFPNGSTCLIVVMPIVISFGESFGLNVLYLSFATVLIVGSTVLLPLNIPPALLASNKGHVDTWEVFVFGMTTLILAFCSVSIAWAVYWPLVDSIVE